MTFFRLFYLKNSARILLQALPLLAILVCSFMLHLIRLDSDLYFTAHLNLNDEYLPYKHIIGQLVLDVWIWEPIYVHSPTNLVQQKTNHIRTVVNKLSTIDTQFRFFKMELLAGEPNYVVKHVRCH